MTLQFAWFVIFIILITGFVILDGFDFGVGIFHLFSKGDTERRTLLNAIGPVWDGNEVWLVTAGGALFAGFPEAYATICSAFYTPIMVLLFGLIFRAVAIEFRSKQPMTWWRMMWDVLFSLASFIIAFGLGFTIGNLIVGIPLRVDKEFIGSLSDLSNPYAFLVGLFAITLFGMHGLIYLLMKTEGELNKRMRRWLIPAILLFILYYILTTVVTLAFFPHMLERIKTYPILALVPFFNAWAIINILYQSHKGNDGWAFISSCLNIICLMALYAIGTFPNIVRASNDPENLSLTLWKASSSALTLEILLLMVAIGLPLVASYTFAVYWIFRGKVKFHSTSY